MAAHNNRGNDHMMANRSNNTNAGESQRPDPSIPRAVLGPPKGGADAHHMNSGTIDSLWWRRFHMVENVRNSTDMKTNCTVVCPQKSKAKNGKGNSSLNLLSRWLCSSLGHEHYDCRAQARSGYFSVNKTSRFSGFSWLDQKA